MSSTMGDAELLLGKGNATTIVMDFWTAIRVDDIIGPVAIYD